MKAFVSWSSGKDCMYAMYKYMQTSYNEVLYLVNMCDVKDNKSRSHSIKKELIIEQSRLLQIPLIQSPTTKLDYEYNFKNIISDIKKEGVEAGIFGDIYLQEHRQWIERVCKDMNITPFFPLWASDTSLLIKQFIEDGFRSIVVAVRKEMLNKKFLGRVIDNTFLEEISVDSSMDLCAERGEYHSFVFDGPCFSSPLIFEKGEITEDNKHWFLQLNL